MPRAHSNLPPSPRQYIKPRMPAFVDFQFPQLVDKPPSALDWVHEIKHDGYRVQVHVSAGVATLYTRTGRLWNETFTPLPELTADLAELPNCIIDAELCALGADGLSDFFALRRALSPGKTAGLVLFCFDLLWKDDEDLRPYALTMRKGLLEDLLDHQGSKRLRYVGELPQGGKAMLDAACQLGLEGIVSKRRDGPYKAGKVDGWRKAKCRPDAEFVIGGWRQAPMSKFEAVLVGGYDAAGVLRYVGAIERGLAAEPGLLKQLQAIRIDVSPFAGQQPSGQRSSLHWVQPELVATVAFNQITDAGKLRQSSFKGLRSDRLPSEVLLPVKRADA